MKTGNLSIIFSITLSFLACAEDERPKLISFSPKSVRMGGLVEIHGKNLPRDGVTIDNKEDTIQVIKWTPDRIVAEVLPEAESGKLWVGESSFSETLHIDIAELVTADFMWMDLQIAYDLVSSSAHSTCGIAEPGNAYCWAPYTYAWIGPVDFHGRDDAGRIELHPVLTATRWNTVQFGAVPCGLLDNGVAACSLSGKVFEFLPDVRWQKFAFEYGKFLGGIDESGRARFYETTYSEPFTSPRTATLVETEFASGVTTLIDLAQNYYTVFGITGEGHLAFHGATDTIPGNWKIIDSLLYDGDSLFSPLTMTKLAEGIAEPLSASSYGATVCIVDQQKDVYCRGENKYYEAGDGTNEPVTQFTKVEFVRNARLVRTGPHTCAVTEDNELICWGGIYTLPWYYWEDHPYEDPFSRWLEALNSQ